MLSNPATFYDGIRGGLFRGSLSQDQVSGIARLLAEADRLKLSDVRYVAYPLATSYHETGSRMQPVREGFATSDAKARAHVKRYNRKYAEVIDGKVYYGRGDVQLTWRDNYSGVMRKLVRELFGVDIREEPDLVLRPDISAFILFEGMRNGETGVGDFTLYSMERFFTANHTDYVGARRIVNGTDRDEQIAGYAHAFENALIAGGWHIAKDTPKVREAAPLAAAVAAFVLALGAALDVDVSALVAAIEGMN